MTRQWIRKDARTLVCYEPGKLSKSEQDLFRRSERIKGAYDFEYNPSTGRTAVIVTEHPEW